MRRGFSLLELLIVVAMVAILGGLALPRLRVERSHVDGAARTIATAMLAARADAVSRGHNVLVVFDTADRVIRTIWDANNNNRLDDGEKTRIAVLGERVAFSRGSGIPAFNGATAQFPELMLVSGDPALIVQRNGALDRACTLYLTSLRGQSGVTDVDARALRFDRATGRATTFLFVNSGWKAQ